MAALLFAWTGAFAFAASLAFFLYSYFVTFGTGPAPASIARDGDPFSPMVVNVTLFTAFALHHSIFARTGVKRLVAAAVSPALERALYTLAASVLFILVCWAWRPVPGVLYSLESPWRWIAVAAVVAGLAATAVGARALDVLDLAGVRQVLGARSGSPARVEPLKTTGLYGFVRHPVYLGWILIVFGVPEMTMTRLMFAAVSTLYLALAVPFEERSLIETFGPEYASYRKRVRWRMLPWIY